MGETCGTRRINYEVHRTVIGRRDEAAVSGKSRHRGEDNIKI
jgi:hypothetical protein